MSSTCSHSFRHRYAYPEALWSRILDLIPLHRKHQAVAVNIAAGQGVAGLELAQRCAGRQAPHAS